MKIKDYLNRISNIKYAENGVQAPQPETPLVEAPTVPSVDTPVTERPLGLDLDSIPARTSNNYNTRSRAQTGKLPLLQGRIAKEGPPGTTPKGKIDVANKFWYLLPVTEEWEPSLEQATKDMAKLQNAGWDFGGAEPIVQLGDATGRTAFRGVVNQGPYSLPFMIATTNPYNLGLYGMMATGAGSGIDQISEQISKRLGWYVLDENGNPVTRKDITGYPDKIGVSYNFTEAMPHFYYPPFSSTSTKFIDREGNWDFSDKNLQRLPHIYSNAPADLAGTYLDPAFWALARATHPGKSTYRFINSVKRIPGTFLPEISQSADLDVDPTWYDNLPRDNGGTIDYPRIFKLLKPVMQEGAFQLNKATGGAPITQNLLLGTMMYQPESYSVINTGRTNDMNQHRSRISVPLARLGAQQGFPENVCITAMRHYQLGTEGHDNDLPIIAASPENLLRIYHQWNPNRLPKQSVARFDNTPEEDNPVWSRLVHYHPYLQRRSDIQQAFATGGELPEGIYPADVQRKVCLFNREQFFEDIAFEGQVARINQNTPINVEKDSPTQIIYKLVKQGKQDDALSILAMYSPMDREFFKKYKVLPSVSLGRTQEENRYNLLRMEPQEMFKWLPYYRTAYGDEAYQEVLNLAFPSCYQQIADDAVDLYDKSRTKYSLVMDEEIPAFLPSYNGIRFKIPQATPDELEDIGESIYDIVQRKLDPNSGTATHMPEIFQKYVEMGIPPKDAYEILAIQTAIHHNLPLTLEQEQYLDNIDFLGWTLNTNKNYHGFEEDMLAYIKQQQKHLQGADTADTSNIIYPHQPSLNPNPPDPWYKRTWNAITSPFVDFLNPAEHPSPPLKAYFFPGCPEAVEWADENIPFPETPYEYREYYEED